MNATHIKLLNNGRGVIVSRQPKLLNSDEEFFFEGAPEGATAIFSSGENHYYRKLNNGCCVLPHTALGGVFGIVVAVMDGKVGSPRFVCEEIKTERLTDGSILMLPNDGELPGLVAELQVENHELREKNGELGKKVETLFKDIKLMKTAFKELASFVKKNNQM